MRIINQKLEIVEDRQQLINKMLSRWRRHRQPKNLEELEARLDEYFTACAELSMLPSVETLALCLAIDRSTLYRWKTGKYRSEAWQRAIQSAYQTILAATAIAGNENKLPPLLTIWREKQLGSHDNVSFEEQALRGDSFEDRGYRLPQDIIKELEALPDKHTEASTDALRDAQREKRQRIEAAFEAGEFIRVPDDYDPDNIAFM